MLDFKERITFLESDDISPIPLSAKKDPDVIESPPNTADPAIAEPLLAIVPDTKKKVSVPVFCAAKELPRPPAIATEAVVLSLGVGDNSFQLPDPAPPPVEEITTCPLEDELIVTLVPATRYEVPSVNLVSDPESPFSAVIDPDDTTSPPKSDIPKEFDVFLENTEPLTNK